MLNGAHWLLIVIGDLHWFKLCFGTRCDYNHVKHDSAQTSPYLPYFYNSQLSALNLQCLMEPYDYMQ